MQLSYGAIVPVEAELNLWWKRPLNCYLSFVNNPLQILDKCN